MAIRKTTTRSVRSKLCIPHASYSADTATYIKQFDYLNNLRPAAYVIKKQQ